MDNNNYYTDSYLDNLLGKLNMNSSDTAMENSNHNINGIRIFQINLQKSKAATSLANKIIVDFKTDILTIQEPYKIHNRVALLNSYKIFPNINTNYEVFTAFVAVNPKLEIMAVSQFCCEYITTVCVRAFLQDFYLLSVYAPPSLCIQEILNTLDSILSQLKNKPVIITGD